MQNHDYVDEDYVPYPTKCPTCGESPTIDSEDRSVGIFGDSVYCEQCGWDADADTDARYRAAFVVTETPGSVIARYLPANYALALSFPTRHLIDDVDSAGWTLDDYVIPRLASGGYAAREVGPDNPADWDWVADRRMAWQVKIAVDALPDAPTRLRNLIHELIHGWGWDVDDRKEALTIANHRTRDYGKEDPGYHSLAVRIMGVPVSS